MRKLISSTVISILFISSVSGLFVWSDSTHNEIKNTYDPTEYCQSSDITTENYEEFCVEVGSEWNNVLLNGDGFEGLDNILTLTRKALENDEDRENGELTFDEANMILSLTSCKSSGIDTVGDCIQQKGSEFGTNPAELADPSELFTTGTVDDVSEGSDSDQDNTDSGTEDSSDTTSDDSINLARSNLEDQFGDWVFRHETIGTDLSEAERPEYTYDESSGDYTLTIEGRDAICGTAKWTREFENSDYDPTQENKFVEVDIKVKDLSTGTSGQSPQTVFLNLDGDRVFEKSNPSPGAEYNVREQMDSSGNTVEIGVEDMDSNNCFDFDRRTSVTITVGTALEPAF